MTSDQTDPRRPLPDRLVAVVVVMFAAQLLTGVLLMTVYSPAPATAWGSVWYIQTRVPAGWFIRGLHHFAADGMLIGLVLLILRSVWSGSCLWSGRAFWWAGLGLTVLTICVSLTGELLPWDQAGYWGTNVRLHILARTPVVGEALRRLLLGAAEPGALTLTRFHALHVTVLPLAMAALVWVLLRPRGSTGPVDGSAASAHRPMLSAPAASAIGLGVVCGVTWLATGFVGLTLLDAPADARASDYPARPEWHTLFLFQWLKYFHGPTAEAVGAIVAPAAAFGVLLAFPLVFRFLPIRWAREACRTTAVGLFVAVAGLTALAVLADRDPSEPTVAEALERRLQGGALTVADQAVLRAREFNMQRRRAKQLARRAVELAEQNGIPPEGPLVLLSNDPLSRGPELFAAHCASCHRFHGHDGIGRVPAEPATSSDLGGYGTREWIRGFLADPMADRFLGRMKKPDGTPAHTRMARVLKELRDDAEKSDETLAAELDSVADYLAHEARHPGELAHAVPAGGRTARNAVADTRGAPPETALRGRRFFERVCNECHSYNGERSGTFRAPEMMGYASAGWIEDMIADPTHESRYGRTGREPAQMPPFNDKLGERERSLLAIWLSPWEQETADTFGASLSD